MNINVEKFLDWVDCRDLEYKDMCLVKWLVTEYGKDHSVEKSAVDKATDEWNSWLNGRIQYHKDDISKGLPTATYNAIARGSRYMHNGQFERVEYRTNRDLWNESDENLSDLRNMSMKKVQIVREYLEANRVRILKECQYD